PACLEHAHREPRVHHDEREIGRFEQRLDRGIAGVPEEFRILRIDGIELAGIAAADEEVERLAADGAELRGGTDDRDRARAEQALKVGWHGIVRRWAARETRRKNEEWYAAVPAAARLAAARLYSGFAQRRMSKSSATGTM